MLYYIPDDIEEVTGGAPHPTNTYTYLAILRITLNFAGTFTNYFLGLKCKLIWYNNYIMEFEFDLPKSDFNQRKHGIDFFEAQALWDDPDVLIIPARTTDEPRFLVVGRIFKKHWSAIIIYREEKIRIISVRRSRPEEVEIYES